MKGKYSRKFLEGRGFAKKTIDEYNKYLSDEKKKKKLKAIKVKKRKPKKSTKSEWKKKYLAYLSGPEWAAIKIKIRELRGNRCEVCESTEKLQVHHKTYDRLFKEKMSDLMLVCDICHKRLHGLT